MVVTGVAPVLYITIQHIVILFVGSDLRQEEALRIFILYTVQCSWK